MKSPRHLLILEDDPFYAELLSTRLRDEWPACELVIAAEEQEFRSALKRHPYDLVLSDYMLPGFNGLKALRLAREHAPGIPFVIVSGTVGDAVAAESLKAGATDYVLKDRIARLIPAIRRALNEVEESNRRKQAETAHQESEAVRDAIMDGALDAIVVLDEAGRILEFNPAAETTFGYARAEIMGQSFVEKMVPPRFHDQQRDDLQHSLAAESGSSYKQRIETTGMRADGAEFSIEMATVPIQWDGRPALTAYLRDITERKKAEEKVRHIQARLVESNKDLRRRNQEIQSFYHTLSHELKTPLTSAREFISIVRDGIPGPLNPTQNEYLGIALESCDQLRVCVNDLLDATRLETGKLTLELKSVRLSPLLQRIITTMSLKTGERGLTLVNDVQPDLPECLIDEHRLTQVVTNLVNNAINYTPARGRITVSAHEVPGQPDWLQVSVSDTGRGIAPEDQDHIFDRLYQVKTGDATTERGIGLGLYLCRELVQLHGGQIWVKSEPGQGSTFHFAVPKDQRALRFNVLVMDDDRHLLDLTRDILSLEYNVSIALDGEEGLSEMRRHVPDIVLLDLVMPRLDGPGTLREIRKNWGSGIPIIVYTAYSGTSLMKDAMEHSPFTLLSKPCPPAQILETVRKMLRSADTTIWNCRQRTVEPELD